MVGAKVYEVSYDNVAPGTHHFKVSATDLGLQESMYYLRLTVDDHVLIRKIMHRQ